MYRPAVLDEHLARASALLAEALKSILEKKGRGAFWSSHEALGVIVEEYYELIQAVRSNDERGIRHELLDLAVACLFEAASMEARRG